MEILPAIRRDVRELTFFFIFSYKATSNANFRTKKN